MVSLTGRASAYTDEETITMASGAQEINTEMGLKSGVTGLATKARSRVGRRKYAVRTAGRMVLCIAVSGQTTRSMASASTSGGMGASMKAAGKITKCMGLASSSGRTDDATKAST